jgi:sulfonate transport system substrate-binding protein
MTVLTRLRALLVFARLATSIARPAAADPAKQLRIGYQKTGLMLVLKGQNLLEKRFAAAGIAVSWVEFQSGPPLVEALNAGSIDIGYVGDTPPIFAQASGVDFVYIGSVPVPGQSSAILVRDAAGIKTLADLRGKKIAVTKGSSAQNVLVQTLAKAGVAYADVQPVYLQPADAGAALRNGSVDAWSIWDPFYALGQKYPGVHVLTDARGIAPSNAFFIASRTYAAQNPGIVAGVIETAQQLDPWIAGHQADVAQVSADASGVDLQTEKVAVARASYDIHYLTGHVVKQQQSIADAFAKLGLLPQPVVVSADVWSPPGRKVADTAPSR